MSKFNTPTASRPRVTSPVTSASKPTLRTFEGAPGFERDAKSELFLLAVSNMVGKNTFYEKAGDRDARFEQLVRQVAVEDPEWMCGFVPWLRNTANMRSAALVAAAEAVKARLDALGGNADKDGDHALGASRRMVDGACGRADEPGEMLAYWVSRYGFPIPKPVKRGVADAVARLYSGRSLLKYDTDSRGFRFGDVIELVRPKAADDKPWQDALFRYALDRRHHPENAVVPTSIRALTASKTLLALPVSERRGFVRSPGAAEKLAEAGFTWEMLAGWLQGPMDAAAWSAIIPSMPVMALCRNLRNFDEAGVSDEVAEKAAARIADAEEVKASRMFPFRFWAAYKAAPSLRWAHTLEKALSASLANVPALRGRTLVLVDRSPSMFPGYGFSTPNDSDITLAEQAAVFGAALALRAEDATLVEFGGGSRPIPVPKGGSVLRLVEAFGSSDGTDIPSAVRKHYAGHDRIVIVTDEQSRAGYLPSNMHRYGGMQETAIDELVPARVPLYLWNFGGYKPGFAPSGGGNRHAFGGLSDAAFKLIPLLESGRKADWKALFDMGEPTRG